MKVLFYLSASKQTGLGHVYRAIVMGSFFKKAKLYAFVDNYQPALNLLQNNGFEILNDIAAESFDIVIFDTPVFPEGISFSGNPFTVSLEIEANVDFVARRPEFFLINPVYREKRARIRFECDSLVMCFGGSDPGGLSLKFAKTVYKYFDTTLFLGEGVEDESVLELFELGVPMKIRRGVSPVPFWEFDIGLVSGGLVMVEALTCGLPVVVVPQNERQLSSTREIEKDLGIKLVFSDPIAALVELSQNHELRRNISTVARSYFLSKRGIKELVYEIMERVKEKI